MKARYNNFLVNRSMYSKEWDIEYTIIVERNGMIYKEAWERLICNYAMQITKDKDNITRDLV